MNIEYRELTLNNGEKDITPIIHEKNGDTFGGFLDFDVRLFKKDIKLGIESVITGKSTEFSFSGNAYELEINDNKVFIYFALAETDEEYYGTCFKTTTNELKKAVDEWCDKLYKFKSKNS